MKPRLAFAFLLVGFLAGCGHLSEIPLLLQGRGTRYECRQEMRVTGINRVHPSSRYDYIVLYPAPGIADTRWVEPLGTIPAGTVIELDGLLQQGPAWLSRILYRVRIVGPDADRWAKEDIRLAGWDKLYAGRDEANQPILSPSYFRRLPP